MPDSHIFLPSRRSLMLIGAAALMAQPALAAPPANGRLRFSVWRNGVRVGEHQMSFAREGALIRVTTDVDMAVKLGPVPVFRYSHEAREQWSDGAFQSLETSSSSNGKRQKVIARRQAGGVTIETLNGQSTVSAQAAPLTHWNSEALRRPMFNPQSGKLLKITASRAGRSTLPDGSSTGARWALRGDAEIENWYDDAGVWTALRGKLEDKSVMEYRRV
jgi:hypothetical protein